MSNVLISLVSDQTIPNVQLIKEFRFIDKYLFISSAEMESQGKRKWIIDACDINPEKILVPIIVNQHSFEDIEDKLSSFEFNDDDNLYVNVTGGTKVMSLAVYEYCKNLKSEIFYITGIGNEFIKLFPKSKSRVKYFIESISLKEYLTSYGFEVKVKTHSFYSKSTTDSLYQLFYSGEIDNFRDVLKTINRNSTFTLVSETSRLNELLSAINFEYENDRISKKDAEYITGGWFEELVYSKIKQELDLHENNIGINVILSKINLKGEKVNNEFDVLFVNQNRLFIIECKTSIFLNGANKSFVGEVIYKSDSLQKGLGLFANTFIFTCSKIKDEHGKILNSLSDHIKRAELNRLKIISLENDILNVHSKKLLNIP